MLDYTLCIKARYAEDGISEAEKASITASKLAYEAGDYMTLQKLKNQ